MTYKDEMKNEQEVARLARLKEYILDRLYRHDACYLGSDHVARLNAYTPQEVWDTNTLPMGMLWWIETLYERYEDYQIVPSRTRTSLGIALARLRYGASSRYYELVDEFAVANCPELRGYPLFEINSQLGIAWHDGLISTTEHHVLVKLLNISQDSGFLGGVLDGLPGLYRAEADLQTRDTEILTLIRLYFPEVPLPSEDQENEVLAEDEEEEDE